MAEKAAEDLSLARSEFEVNGKILIQSAEEIEFEPDRTPPGAAIRVPAQTDLVDDPQTALLARQRSWIERGDHARNHFNLERCPCSRDNFKRNGIAA